MKNILQVCVLITLFSLGVSSVGAYDNLNGGRFFNGESIFDGKSIYGNGALNRQRILGRLDGIHGYNSSVSVWVPFFGSSSFSSGLRSDFGAFQNQIAREQRVISINRSIDRQRENFNDRIDRQRERDFERRERELRDDAFDRVERIRDINEDLNRGRDDFQRDFRISRDAEAKRLDTILSREAREREDRIRDINDALERERIRDRDRFFRNDNFDFGREKQITINRAITERNIVEQNRRLDAIREKANSGYFFHID